MGEIGDKCVVIAYQLNTQFTGADVVFCDKYNNAVEGMKYG